MRILNRQNSGIMMAHVTSRFRLGSQQLLGRRHFQYRSFVGQHQLYYVPSLSNTAAAFQSPSYVHDLRNHRKPTIQSHQRRTYQISLARDDSKHQDANIINDDIDNETMARHNTLSRRLYRTLLRSCKQGVVNANRGNSIDSSTLDSSGDDKSQWILLQPPMDQRKYGFAKIAVACRGDYLEGEEEISSSSLNTSYNEAVGNMTNKEVGMAMEVLRFVHISLGGYADDDLEEYYLGGSSNVGGDDDVSEEDKDEKEDVQEELVVEGKSISAAAGRHSEGHYTQFIDEDEERGEGDHDDKNIASKEENKDEKENDEEIPDAEWDSDDDNDEEEEDDGLESDESVLVTSTDLQNAIRIAFRAPLFSSTPEEEDVQPKSTIVARRHRDAINACSQLSQQFNLWGRNKSSIAVDWEKGVRVVATSALMMRPASSGTRKYRFCYRIRVENIADMIDAAALKNKNEIETQTDGKEEGSEDKDGKEGSEDVEHRAVQILGRTWNISERGTSTSSWHKTSSSSVLQRLLEEGVITGITNDGKNGNTDGDGSNALRVVQTVNEPRTGAVGHLPVLGPGEVFEYMSGADIATPTGAMEGCFHMASVDMQKTDSAHVGDQVESLTWKPNDKRRFEMPVGRFGLVADADDEEEDA